jgi:hypothetical protein
MKSNFTLVTMVVVVSLSAIGPFYHPKQPNVTDHTKELEK